MKTKKKLENASHRSNFKILIHDNCPIPTQKEEETLLGSVSNSHLSLTIRYLIGMFWWGVLGVMVTWSPAEQHVTRGFGPHTKWLLWCQAASPDPAAPHCSSYRFSHHSAGADNLYSPHHFEGLGAETRTLLSPHVSTESTVVPFISSSYCSYLDLLRAVRPRAFLGLYLKIYLKFVSSAY